jgi:hypothetical protein
MMEDLCINVMFAEDHGQTVENVVRVISGNKNYAKIRNGQSISRNEVNYVQN